MPTPPIGRHRSAISEATSAMPVGSTMRLRCREGGGPSAQLGGKAARRLHSSLGEVARQPRQRPWDSGRFDDALKAAEKVEALWRSLAERQPDAYTADWARSLSNLSEAQLNFGRFASALGTAEKAVSRITSFVERYPIVYAPWLGFARRVIAGAYLKLERIDEAAAEARASADIWTDVATTRKNYESRQVAKSFLTLIQCEQALDQNDAVLSTFKRALDLLRTIERKPKTLGAHHLSNDELGA